MNASKWYRGGLLLVALSLVTMLAAATGAAAPSRAFDAPVITSFSPHSGPVGTQVTIRGAHLSGATVMLGTVNAPITSAPRNTSDSQVTISIPTGTDGGIISVTAGGATAKTTIPFRITPGTATAAVGKPVVFGISPMKVKTGAMITLSGQNLTGVKYVKVGGVKASFFKAISKTKLSVKVPAGAKTGKVSVVTTFGAGTSAATLTVH